MICGRNHIFSICCTKKYRAATISPNHGLGMSIYVEPSISPTITAIRPDAVGPRDGTMSNSPANTPNITAPGSPIAIPPKPASTPTISISSN